MLLRSAWEHLQVGELENILLDSRKFHNVVCLSFWTCWAAATDFVLLA